MKTKKTQKYSNNKKNQKNKKSDIKKTEKTFEGTLSITKYGYGFVDITKNEGIFVSEKNLNGGFTGDTVRAKLINKGRKPECKVTEILKRNISFLVGSYHKDGKQAFLIPFNQKIPFAFKIKHFNPDITIMLSENDIIVGDILSYGSKDKAPTIYIREYLGKYEEKGNDMLVVMRKYGIDTDFPEEVLTQKINEEITDDELLKRDDYTSDTIVTIDGDDAKDLDDAVCVKKEVNGYTLGVHIADVSHYVKSNCEIDKEAFKRGTSVYFPDRVAPMLPFKLSNGLCSLNPNETKLTFSCIMKIDINGNIIDYKIRKSFIRSKARLTYNIVKKIILKEYDDTTKPFENLKDDINNMYELYKIMREKRKRDTFVEFDFPETKFTLDENGKAIDVFPYPVSFSNEIIEEFMLAANTCVADFAMENDFPFVYRVHGEPNSEKIQNLYKTLDSLGIKHTLSPHPTPGEFNEILFASDETQYSEAVHRIALRSMQKAVYSNVPIGHYGLNFKKYCHFTSPIRRYPDLMIHRILSDYLNGKSIRRYTKTVSNIAKQSSDREINSFMAEREADDVKKAQYMESCLGNKYEGFISGMCESGFFVELPNTVEGFVPLASIKGDYFKYYEEAFMMRSTRSKKTFTIGEKVKIIVDKCDVINGKIDFFLDD